MRIASQLRSGKLGFNMTPMIDVVFLLIIFFLVSSHLARQEAQMPLPLPVASTAEDVPAVASRLVTLNIQQDGTLILAGHRIDPQQLLPRLEQARQQQSEPLEVRIRSDRRVPYRIIEPVMLACARAGVWSVTFGVYRSEGGG